LEESKDGPAIGRTRRFVHYKEMTMVDPYQDMYENKKKKDKDVIKKVKKQSINVSTRVYDF